MNNTPVLFNRKILNKYLTAFSNEQIEDYELKREEILKWKKSVEKSDLQKTKETSVQGLFLKSVFEKVLGYSTFLEGGEWNQLQEFKSKLDGSESDGALGFFTSKTKIVRTVIELKDANSDLDKKQHRSNHLTPVEQAFSYANKNGSGCGWVIVSNFVEIRLYKSSSSLEYERFLVTNLDNEAEFKRFYFLLCKDNLIEKTGKSLVDKIYDDNEQAQDEISNEFYNDYKRLRADLFQALKQNNPQTDEMTLFSKAQKILDRFIFICFCEDKTLLPKGIFKSVIEASKHSFVMSPNRLWEQLRGLFHSIDKGNPPMKINGYNGGLFREDAVLDGLVIPDDILERFTKLSDYDFESDLNVNIMGHIFEQSISDLEQFKAELAGNPVDKQSSKQKADGIFYTPPYVTKFIVEKTVGRWLNDEKEQIKRELIGLNGYTVTIGRRKITLKKWEEIPEELDNNANHDAITQLHIDFWDKYIEILKTIRVLDPACGSGAFLNQAFDYLCDEGNYAVEMQTSLKGGQMSLFDWDKYILQNNLFGVDLNIESVEITKLSLWLKTARSNSELASLDENIKCGNSIINSVEIVGERAFDWNKEFPFMMSQGGFDVVIGNPPYGATLSQSEKDYLVKNFKTTEGGFDTYKTFFELAVDLLKENGYLGYITPCTYLILINDAKKLRKFLFEKTSMLEIVELHNVFPTAKVDPLISTFQKKIPANNDKLSVIRVPKGSEGTTTFISDGIISEFNQVDLREKEGYVFTYWVSNEQNQLKDKISMNITHLCEIADISQGLIPYDKYRGHSPETIKNRIWHANFQKDETYRKELEGKDVKRYSVSWNGENWISYGDWLAAPRKPEYFINERILIREITNPNILAGYTTKEFYNTPSIINCINFKVNIKYVLGIINSKLMSFYHKVNSPKANKGLFPKILVDDVRGLPIKVDESYFESISGISQQLIDITDLKNSKENSFIRYIAEIYKPKTITEKLSEFYKLDFKGFVDELKKQGVKLTPKQEMELMPLFQETAKEITEISKTVDRLDNELDEVVFALYGLTDGEKAIVDNK